METSTIEKLDKSRYNMLFWMTIGFGLFFGEVILKEFLHEKSMLMIVQFLGIIGWIFFLKSSIISFKINKQIKNDIKLKEALNNEMHKLFALKSYMIGFWIFLISTTVFIVLSFFTGLSLRISLMIILYVGVLSTFISGLIYNKN